MSKTKPLAEKITEMYCEEINPKKCKKCFEKDIYILEKYQGSRERNHPQSYWHLGKNIQNGKYPRLAFIGKNSWTQKSVIEEIYPLVQCKEKFGHIYDSTSSFPHFWKNVSYQYWSAYQEILSCLEYTPDDIFISNMSKCSINKKLGGSTDITNILYYRHCARIIEKEVQIVKPTHLIFFVGSRFDDIIKKMKFNYEKYRDITDEYCKKPINDIDVYWWHRDFFVDNEKMSMLRTRHPERAPSGFTNEVITWIKETSIHR